MENKSVSHQIRRSQSLERYLNELSQLTGRNVICTELGTVNDALEIQKASQKFITQKVSTYEIPFSQRNSTKFLKIIEELYNKNPLPIYIWTPRTIDCGTFLVFSLRDIHFNFEFNINTEGIIVLLSHDLVDRVLLDFFELNTGERRMKIAIQGDNWESIHFDTPTPIGSDPKA